MVSRRQFIQLLPFSLTLLDRTTQAQTLRLENARVIVGFAPGGTADIVGRKIAEKMQGVYAKSVVCENKTGAGGQIAVQLVKNAPPDGASILLTPMSMLGIYPHTYQKLPYDPINDLQPVSGAALFDYAFAVGPAVPEWVKTISDFLKWAKAHPELANFGSPAAGSSPHFIGTLLGKLGSVDLRHIPFRGTQPAIVDLIGGQIAAVCGPTGEFTQFTKAGKCRLLATSGPTRNLYTPNILTLKEQGFSELTFTEWYGIFLPAGSPQPIIDRLNNQIYQVLKEKSLIDGLSQAYLTAYPTSPNELAQQLKVDSQKWRKIVSAVGFTPEG